MPDTFDDDSRPVAEPAEGSAPTTEASPGSTSDDVDFDIDLDFGGSSTAAAATDDIDLDFTGGTSAPEPETDGIDLNFGVTEEDEADDEDETDDENDAGAAALEAFRSELRAKLGDWYVVHTYSGMENRVQQNLENRVSSLNMEDYIYEIVVPTEEVTEIRNGQRKQIKRTVLPGYVLVRMS